MPKTTPRSSRPSRLGNTALTFIRIALFLALVVFVNFISSKNFTRSDLSREGAYTLSSSTARYVASEAIAERENPVKLVMVFRRASPFYERVRALAEEYARLSKGKIELEIIDPLRAPERAQQFAANYNLSLVSDLLLVDARATEDTPVVVETTVGTPSLNPNITLAIADEMLGYAIDETGQRRPATFRAEDLITARLVEAIEGKPRTFLFLADKSRTDTETENAPWTHLASALRYQNVQLIPANISENPIIPEGVNGLAVIAPRYDFTEEEIKTLEAYWNSPRAALLILLSPGETPPRLRAFLRANGVTPQRDRIITRTANRLITTARGTFTRGVPFLSDLAGQSVIFEGASSSIEVRENAEDLAIRQIAPVPLIQASDVFWGETKFGEGNEEFNPVEDRAPPLYLAAAVTRGATRDDRFFGETSRMIVVTNTDFLDPDRQLAENIDFLSSSVNWLVHREELTGLSPRTIGTYKMPLLDAQVSFINRLNLVFAPLAFLIIGGIVFSTRRR